MAKAIGDDDGDADNTGTRISMWERVSVWDGWMESCEYKRANWIQGAEESR